MTNVGKEYNILINSYPRNRILDSRGCLEVIEFDSRLPFFPRRIYFLYDVPEGQNRGLHAHKELEQVIICLNGSVDFKVTDSKTEEFIHLTSKSDGYHIPSGIWRELLNFSQGAVILVLASHHFDTNDYIYSLDEFQAWAHGTSK